MNLCFTPPTSLAAAPHQKIDSEKVAHTEQTSAGVEDALAALANKFAEKGKEEPEILCGFGGKVMNLGAPKLEASESPEILCGFGGLKVKQQGQEKKESSEILCGFGGLKTAHEAVTKECSDGVFDAFAALAAKYDKRTPMNEEAPTPTYEAPARAQSERMASTSPASSIVSTQSAAPLLAGVGGRKTVAALDVGNSRAVSQSTSPVPAPSEADSDVSIIALGVPKRTAAEKSSKIDDKLNQELERLRDAKTSKPKKKTGLRVEFNPTLVLREDDVKGGPECEILCGVGLGKLQPERPAEPKKLGIARTTSAGNLQDMAKIAKQVNVVAPPQLTVEEMRRTAALKRAKSHQCLQDLAEEKEEESQVLCGFGGAAAQNTQAKVQYFGFSSSKPSKPKSEAEEKEQVELLAGFGVKYQKDNAVERSPELLAGFGGLGGMKKKESSPEVLAGFGGNMGARKPPPRAGTMFTPAESQKSMEKGKKKVEMEVVKGFGESTHKTSVHAATNNHFFDISQSAMSQKAKAQSQLAADLLKEPAAKEKGKDKAFDFACEEKKFLDQLKPAEVDNRNQIPDRPMFDPLRSGEDLFDLDDDDETSKKKGKTRTEDMRNYVRMNDSEQVVAKLTFLMDDNEDMAKRNDELEGQLANAAMTRERAEQNNDRLRTYLGDVRGVVHRATDHRRGLDRVSFDQIRNEGGRAMSIAEMSSASGQRIQNVVANIEEWERSLLSARENPSHEDQYLSEEMRDLKLVSSESAMLLIDLLKENARLKQEMNEMSEHLTQVTEQKNNLFLQAFNASHGEGSSSSRRHTLPASQDESSSTPNQRAVLPVGVVFQEEEPSTHTRYYEGVGASGCDDMAASYVGDLPAMDSMRGRPQRPLRHQSDSTALTSHQRQRRQQLREEMRYGNADTIGGSNDKPDAGAVNQFQSGENIFLPINK